jgi:hypothetical protein
MMSISSCDSVHKTFYANHMTIQKALAKQDSIKNTIKTNNVDNE